MARLNEVDKYLLDKWRSVFALQAAWETLGSKIRKYLGEIYEEVKEKEWWDAGVFEDAVDRYGKNEILFTKKIWRFGEGKWDTIFLGLWGIFSLEDLLRNSTYPPAFYVGTDVDFEQKQRFNTLFMQNAADELKKLNYRNDNDKNYPIFMYLSESPEGWVEILKNDGFVKRVLEYIDILALFIEPVDKTLTALLKKK